MPVQSPVGMEGCSAESRNAANLSHIVAPRTLHVPNKLPLVEDPLRESGRAELEHPAAQSQMCQESKRLGLKT